MWEHLGLFVTAGGLLLNLIGSAVIITRALSRVEIALLKAIADERKEIDTARANDRKEFEASIETVERRFGEIVAAQRTKIGELELYIRDHYVRREGFYKVKEEIDAAIEKLGDRLAKQIEKLEAKIGAPT